MEISESEVIFEDLDIWEATIEAIKLILIFDREKKMRRYYPPNPPSISTVRRFLYKYGRSKTRGLTKAWMSLIGLMRISSG